LLIEDADETEDEFLKLDNASTQLGILSLKLATTGMDLQYRTIKVVFRTAARRGDVEVSGPLVTGLSQLCRREAP
jgi:hypothetical protein